MNIVKLVIINLVLMSGWLVQADTPAAPPTPPADPLAQALPILQSKYADFIALDYKPGDKLDDLITRSKGEISVVPESHASKPDPIIAAPLAGDVVYWRLSSFNPEKSWADLTTPLQQTSATTSGIILDLRSNNATDDYAGAAAILGIFEPSDFTLAKYSASVSPNTTGAPVTSHPILAPIVVLTNAHTTGAAEALTACLQADGALVMGRPTAGKIGVIEEDKLSSGQVLRFLAAPIAADKSSVLLKLRPNALAWNQPVNPDITLTVDDHSEKAVLTLIKDNHISDVIEESPQRHRMSEASLVQGQDPEWDDYLTSLEEAPVLLSLPVIRDVALIEAIDSLKAIRLSQRTVPTPIHAGAANPISTSVQ